MSVVLKTSITLLTLICSVVLFCPTFAADTDVIDEIGIEIPISCTMSGTGTNTHYASIPNGIYSGSYTDPSTNTNYANGIGTTTVKAFCNDNQGFSIYAIGYTDNEEGKNVLTNSTLGSTYDIITGTATGPVGTNDISNWSMKLSTITSPTPTYPIAIQNSFDNYHAVPDDYTLVAKRESATDVGQNAVGSTLTTTYAAYISKTQPAGLYEGQVKYTMVHPYDTAAPEKPISIADAEYLQDVNTCPATLQEEQVYTLKDKRDNQEYKVAKLKDGKCWMVENLNIAGGTALSSEDTDFDSNYTLPTTNGWTVTDGKLVLPASATKNPDNNDLTDSSQFSTDDYAYVFNSGNKENCGGSSQNTPCYSYYSWDTATLGSGRSISTDNTDADYSICPKNWKLPTSRYTSTFDAATAQDSDLYNLATNYGMSTGMWSQSTSSFYDQAGPGTIPNFLFAGFYYGGSFGNGGSFGGFWSSTSYFNADYARILCFDSGDVYISSADSGLREVGSSVRCLFGV